MKKNEVKLWFNVKLCNFCLVHVLQPSRLPFMERNTSACAQLTNETELKTVLPWRQLRTCRKLCSTRVGVSEEATGVNMSRRRIL